MELGITVIKGKQPAKIRAGKLAKTRIDFKITIFIILMMSRTIRRRPSYIHLVQLFNKGLKS